MRYGSDNNRNGLSRYTGLLAGIIFFSMIGLFTYSASMLTARADAADTDTVRTEIIADEEAWYEVSDDGKELTVGLEHTEDSGYVWKYGISIDGIIEPRSMRHMVFDAVEGMNGRVTLVFHKITSFESAPVETRELDILVENGRISIENESENVFG